MGIDRISNLPDDVLCKILYFVPTKLAASACILSKRWSNMRPYPQDSLDFDESMLLLCPPKGEEEEEEAILSRQRHDSFACFVDKTIDRLSAIKKFTLKFGYDDDEARLNRWIRTALERGCLELYLESEGCADHLIDSEFFTSSALVKLTLSGGFDLGGGLPCGGVFFPALKTLVLVSICFQTLEICKDFIHGCPALEEIFISVWMGRLSSPYVKRVTITTDFDDEDERQHQHGGLTLDLPSLVYLDYSCFVANDYFVHLDSLIEARLDLRLYELYDDYSDDDDDDEVEISGDITPLLNGMTKIRSLHLSPYSLEVFHLCCNTIPEFNNLLSLTIESDQDRGWQVLPRLLDNSPNLQTLAIKGLVHKVTEWCGDACVCIPSRRRKKKKSACCLSRCGVKVLEILEYGGSLEEQNMMRHFLAKLECLETVKVRFQDDSNHNHYYYLRAKLMSLPRISSKCKIQYI